MKDVLREWHYIDPADDWEINRSSAIGDEQGNRNPFVHDSTLVRRAYYPGSSSVQPEEMLAQEIVPVVAYPNPFNAGTNIQITLANSSDISLKVFNPLGQEVSEITNEQVAAGTQTFHFDGSCLPSGHYYLVVAVDGNSTVRKKLILLK